jgi:excisionase family DNA binding protein
VKITTERQFDSLLLRIPEVALVLGVSRGTVYNMISAGDLATVTVGKSGIRIARTEIYEWIQRRANTGKGAIL